MLVLAETRDGVPSPLTRELLGHALELAQQVGTDVAALLIGRSSDAAVDLISHGAARVYFCEQPESEYEGEAWVAVAERLARDIQPFAILAGHTSAGADLGPRLAFRLGTAATGSSRCARIGEASLHARVLRGNVRETLSPRPAPAIATVKGCLPRL